MQNKECYDIRLDNLSGFFSDSRTSTFFKSKEIYNFGDLLDFSNTSKYRDLKNSNSALFYELDGSIKLLNYKLFGIDPGFDEKTELCEFGFSSKAYLSIKFFKLMEEFNNWFEALQVFSSEDVMEIFTYVHMLDSIVAKEIKEKADIINDFHREKINNQASVSYKRKM